jgi:hypothetical protein
MSRPPTNITAKVRYLYIRPKFQFKLAPVALNAHSDAWQGSSQPVTRKTTAFKRADTAQCAGFEA